MPNAIPLPAADPDQIGQYRLAGRLVAKARKGTPRRGEPKAGTVYLARASQNEPVTITLLDPVPATDSATRDGFMAEARVARRVAPFCAARILDAGFHRDFPYLVCEYIPGPSLREAVESEGPRGSDALHAIAIGAATGLAAIHQAGLVHGEFGPDHVVLGRDGPRILHAGISPPYGPATPTGDVLAWARTVLFAASGQRRPGPSQPREVTALPESLRQVIADCLDPDPAARPTAKMVVTRLLGHTNPPAGVLAEGSRMAAGLGPAPMTSGPAAQRPGAGAEPALAPTGQASPATYLSWRGGAPWRTYTEAPDPSAPGPEPAAAAPATTGPAGPAGNVAAATPSADAAGGAPRGAAGATAADPAEDRYFRKPHEAVRAVAAGPASCDMAGAGSGLTEPARRPARQARPAAPPRRLRRVGWAWAAIAAPACVAAAIGGIVFVFLQRGDPGAGLAPVPSHGRQADPRPSAPPSSAPTPSGSATPEIPSAFNGTWAGSVRQHSALGLSFAVQISLTGGGESGTVSYPSLGCSGPLTPLSASNSKLVLQQGVISGQQTCGQGRITLTQQPDGTLSYSFTPQVAGGPSTTGTLSHQ
jgi:hypothetical protein